MRLLYPWHSVSGRELTCLILYAILSFEPTTNAQNTSPTTLINVGTAIQRSGVKRLGINLGGHTFYDSEQIMNNLAFRNPGFEGETWQAILHCKTVTATSCTDDNIWTVWPVNFLEGASIEFIFGVAAGATGSVVSSTAADSTGGTGVSVTFTSVAGIPSPGDYAVVRLAVPGNAQAGWWTSLTEGATLATERTDLSANSPGMQALRVVALNGATPQTATISSFFDTTAGHSFVQLNGNYTLFFRAKLLSGTSPLSVKVARLGSQTFFETMPALTTAWQDLSYTFAASESGEIGPGAVSFTVVNGSVLLDDVSLSKSTAMSNPTSFRDEVVSALRDLRPGILRYMDSGTDFGSSLDNMLAPPFARQRPGYNNFTQEADDIPVGLHEFLLLCQTVGAEPWYTLQAGMSITEMQNLMDYLGGTAATTYGSRRAALGQAEPWTSVFPVIHLEYGNEVWNTANPGATMTDPVAYGTRAAVLFNAARSSHSYTPASFDLILDGWAVLPYWNKTVLANSSGYDTIDVAPYLFSSFNDDSSIESIFGPMFAQPEAMDSTSGGLMLRQAGVAASAAKPASLAVYESNLGTIGGTASQNSVSEAMPSLGAGLTTTEHLLLMIRDLGVLNVNMFQLTGFEKSFNTPSGTQAETTPLWGTVVDMGNTNLHRPSFVAQQLANSAILPIMLASTQTGANPTWDQPTSTNDNISLTGAHFIQSFSFTNGVVNKLIVFNLSRTDALPVSFTGFNAPAGEVTVQTLTSSAITDSNESAANVYVQKGTLSDVSESSVFSLSAHSMTVFSSNAPAITSVDVFCSPTAVLGGTSASCTSSITGTGTFNDGVAWTASVGAISAAGAYTAPSAVSPSEVAIITGTSLQNPSKNATVTISLLQSNGPSVSSVAIACTPTTLVVGRSGTCFPTVTGTGAFNSAVQWSTTSGSISTGGLYTAPASVPPYGLSVITATSIGDPTEQTTASISIIEPPAPVISALTFTALSSTSVAVSWLTDVPARNGVNYGPSAGYGTTTPFVNELSQTPSFSITGLTPATLYYWMIWSEVDGQVASSITSFTTPSA